MGNLRFQRRALRGHRLFDIFGTTAWFRRFKIGRRTEWMRLIRDPLGRIRLNLEMPGRHPWSPFLLGRCLFAHALDEKNDGRRRL